MGLFIDGGDELRICKEVINSEDMWFHYTRLHGPGVLPVGQFGKPAIPTRVPRHTIQFRRTPATD